VTNDKFTADFQNWANRYQDTALSASRTGRHRGIQIKIVNDGSTSDDNKLGAIGDINLVLTRENVPGSDLIVVAGDNLFSEPLTQFVNFARQTDATVGAYDVGDFEAIKKYGMVVADENAVVTHFEEKPKEPKTTLAAIALYFYS